MNKYLPLAFIAFFMVTTHGHAAAQASTTKKTTVAKSSKKTAAPESASVDDAKSLGIRSSAAVVIDQATGSVLYEKNAQAVVPIASITKLMTAMVVLDQAPDLNEMLTVSPEDVDMLKGTRSRLTVGSQLSREDMLHLALMASENRAAAALSRYYPGGRPGFIAAMNSKAESLGLNDTRFFDSTGLTSENVSSARDLVKMVTAAHRYPLIRQFSTTPSHEVSVNGRMQGFNNTNSLVRNASWDIGLSKTGYISEAGKCLVMQAWFNQRPTVIVLLDSWGKLTRVADANRIRRWIEANTVAHKPKLATAG